VGLNGLTINTFRYGAGVSICRFIFSKSPFKVSWWWLPIENRSKTKSITARKKLFRTKNITSFIFRDDFLCLKYFSYGKTGV